MENTCLDIEKLKTFDKETRKMLMNLFIEYTNTNNSDIYKVLENYNVFISSNGLSQKIKINYLIEECKKRKEQNNED